VVVAAVGKQRVRFAAGTADPAADRRDRVEQGQELGDVARGCRRSAGRRAGCRVRR
jgi:hypothetical protein